jgi:carboxypeptidase C (cathepsin A)
MGEDFAGRYLPRFARALDDYSQKGGQVSLASVVIGNPYVSGVLQNVEAWHAAKGLDLVDESNFGQLAAL